MKRELAKLTEIGNRGLPKNTGWAEDDEDGDEDGDDDEDGDNDDDEPKSTGWGRTS